MRRRPAMLRWAAVAAMWGLAGFPAAWPVLAQTPAPPAAAPATPVDLRIDESASVEDLFKKVQQWQQAPPASTTPEEQQREMLERLAAMKRAAEVILKKQPPDEQRAAAVGLKFQVLMQLVNAGQATAKAEFTAFAASLVDDPLPQVAELARYQAFLAARLDLQSAPGGPPAGPERFGRFLHAAMAYVKYGEPDSNKAQVALLACRILEYQEAYEQAALAYQEFATLFENRGELQFLRLAGMFRANADRMALVGKPIELDGTTLSGEPFDWAAYRGKVVLVDFWASWCGPCRQEMVNIVEQYRAMHGQGFEVVGVNLDDPADLPAVKELMDQVQKSLKDAPAWTNLIAEKPETSGWDHPLAQKFAVSSLPSTLLVDKQGKVVSLVARGDKLKEHLRKLLGEASAINPAVPKPPVVPPTPNP